MSDGKEVRGRATLYSEAGLVSTVRRAVIEADDEDGYSDMDAEIDSVNLVIRSSEQTCMARLGSMPVVELYLGASPEARAEGGKFDSPKHTIRVKTLANDTELPGLRVDYKKQEVSFRWLDMFDRLYREQKVLVSTMMRLIDEVDKHRDLNNA